MKSPLERAMIALVDAWVAEAGHRRRVSAVDPAANAMEFCARELRKEIERVDRETAYLTVSDFAKTKCVSESTVRRLCAGGELEGALKGFDGDWRIPRNARRRPSQLHRLSPSPDVRLGSS